MTLEMCEAKCLRCGVQSNEWMLEANEVPVCDICVGEMCEVTVRYDGSKDLLEHLQTELKGSRCPHCYKTQTGLEGIRYGAPTDAFMKCGNCSKTHIFDVHIDFVDEVVDQ